LPFTFSLNEEHATDNKTCNRTWSTTTSANHVWKEGVLDFLCIYILFKFPSVFQSSLFITSVIVDTWFIMKILFEKYYTLSIWSRNTEVFTYCGYFIVVWR
jgi:hypothetical protein